MNQICEQRHRAEQREHNDLQRGSDTEYPETDCDGTNVGMGPDDGAIDPAVDVTVLLVVLVCMCVVVLVRLTFWRGRGKQETVSMPSAVRMAVEL